MQISARAFLGGMINEYARRLTPENRRLRGGSYFERDRAGKQGRRRPGQSCATSGLAASGLARRLNRCLA
jgi:hypothetical protein